MVEVGGSHEYRPLRTLPLHLPRATHILVLDARLGYEELQAQATAWLDLARVCMSRKSVGWALRLRVPLLLVFSNADHSSVRVLKNPRNNMNSSNVSDRVSRIFFAWTVPWPELTVSGLTFHSERGYMCSPMIIGNGSAVNMPRTMLSFSFLLWIPLCIGYPSVIFWHAICYCSSALF